MTRRVGTFLLLGTLFILAKAYGVQAETIGTSSDEFWVKLINQVGVPVGFLTVLAWYLLKYVLPYFKSLLEHATMARDESQKQFMVATEKFLDALEKQREQSAQDSRRLAEQLNEIHKDIISRMGSK